MRRRFGERECVSHTVTEKSYVTGSFVALPLEGGLFGDKASYDLEVGSSCPAPAISAMLPSPACWPGLPQDPHPTVAAKDS
jgi:hypothetical protein